MAARYWVGGTSTWDATAGTKWSLTSGGVGGQAVPTSSDAVTIDAGISGTFTITVSTAAVCSTLTISNANAILTMGANITCSSTATFNGGTINLVSYILTCASLVSSTGTRSLTNASGGSITCVGSGVGLNITPTSLTVSDPIIVTFTYASTAAMSATTGSVAGTSDKFSLNFIGAGAHTIAITAGNIVNNLTFASTVVGSLSNTGFNIIGNLTLGSNASFSATAGTNAITFIGTTTQTITSNGKTLPCPITFNGTAYTLADNLTVGAAVVNNNNVVNLTRGILNLNGKILLCGVFSSSNTNTRTITQGTGGLFYCYYASANPSFDVIGSGLTVTGTQANNIVNYVGSYTPNSSFTFILIPLPAGFLSFFY